MPIPILVGIKASINDVLQVVSFGHPLPFITIYGDSEKGVLELVSL
jgi:hypothetical protein